MRRSKENMWLSKDAFLKAVLTTIVAVMAAIPGPSYALKINTHIWVGQQVINDLSDDGRISILLRGQIVTLPVPEHVKNAILMNKNEYLLGHIGPDALPDIVVGQSTLHPGSKTGWKANDWMNYLLRASATSDIGKAFTYGYLGHAAADVFAHTYVNQYAGDHFDLFSGEVLSEERHIALEGYIGKHTPDLTDNNGYGLGLPQHVVQPSDALAAFVRDQMIYAPQAQEEYGRSGYAGHLVAFSRYRSAIDRLAEDGVWRQIDIAVARYIGAQYGVALSSEEAGRVVDEIARLNSKINQGINLTQAEINDLNARISALDLRFAQRAKDAFDRVSSLEAGLLSAQNELEQLLVTKVCEQVDEVCRVPVPGITCKWYGCWPTVRYVTDPVCAATFRAACRTTQTLISLRNDAQQRLFERRGQLAAELLSLHAEMVSARSSALVLTDAFFDVLQIPTQGSSPIQAVLRNWRSDVDLAFAAYVKAASQSIINTMDSYPRVSAIEPMQRWLDCYGPALQGVPVFVSGCETRDAALRIMRTLDRLAKLPADSLAIGLGLPTSTQIKDLMARVQADVMVEIKDQVANGLIRLLPEKFQGILEVLSENMSADRLQYYFSKPESAPSIGLITIPDIAQRVDREMVTNGKNFDPQKFAAVHNGVVLSKLALLDNAGLNQLAQLAGVTVDANGSPTFAGTENIVADAFVSLDGNHQWLDVAPARPTAFGFPPRRFDGRDMGYASPSGYRSVAGFVPWRPAVRDALFRALFVGPISPGVEGPFEIGMPDILPPGYLYRPCKIHPFPNDEADTTCVGRLIPWSPPVIAPPPPPPPLPSPMIVTTTPLVLTWSRAGSGAISGTATVSVSGGVAPFGFSWVWLSGDPTVTVSGGQTATFSAPFVFGGTQCEPGEPAVATFRLSVSNSAGQTLVQDRDVTLRGRARASTSTQICP